MELKPVASQLNGSSEALSGDRLWLPDAAAAVIPSNAPQSDASVQDALNLAPTGPEHCTLEQTSIIPLSACWGHPAFTILEF